MLTNRLPATVGGTGAVVATLPTGWAINDLLILACESNGGEAVTTPSGWALLATTPQDAGAATTRLTVFWKFAVSGETAPTVADPGDHLNCTTFAFAGVDLTTPIAFSVGAINATSTTAIAWTNISAANAPKSSYVLNIASFQTDTAVSQLSAYSVPDLEVPLINTNAQHASSAGVTSGNGGGFIYVGGYVSGSSGMSSSAATLVTASPTAKLSIVINQAADTTGVEVFNYQTTFLVDTLGAPDAVVIYNYQVLFLVDTEVHVSGRRRGFMSFSP